MRAEEEKLAALSQHMGAVVHKINSLTAAEVKTEQGVLNLPAVPGAELQALTAFRARIRKHQALLETEKQQCERQIVAQRAQLLKARKDLRVLEKLKEKRHKTWVYLNDRELESLAADSFFSKLARPESEA